MEGANCEREEQELHMRQHLKGKNKGYDEILYKCNKLIVVEYRKG